MWARPFPSVPLRSVAPLLTGQTALAAPSEPAVSRRVGTSESVAGIDRRAGVIFVSVQVSPAAVVGE
jgi:hypothetical protein